MADAGRGADALGLFLTGGASNGEPDSALGGAISSVRCKVMGLLTQNPVPAIRFDEIHPANGEGEGSLLVNPDGDLVWTPPGGTAGDPVTVASGASAVVTGQDTNKALRVYREAGLPMAGLDTPILRWAFNGAIAMKNVTQAQRAAGVTTYRALAVKAVGDFALQNVRVWLPGINNAQAVFSVAWETPAGGVIQTIADEETAPTGVTWSTPRVEADAISTYQIQPGEWVGLWIRRVFPVGMVSPREDVQLAMKYEGA